MEVLDSLLKRYIMKNEYYHHLFINVDEGQISLIKQKINESPFLDFVLEFEDYYKLDGLINSVPETEPNRTYIINRIIEEYLYFKIIEKFNTRKYDVNRIKSILFGQEYEKYKDIDTILWMVIEREIEEACQETEGKRARFHFFMDSVNDIRLQRKINDLYARRTKIVMMGYTTKDDLITYSYDKERYIQDPHDYQTHDLKLKQ